MSSLAVVSTHPVQYYAPIFRELSEKLEGRIKVFYEIVPNRTQQGVGYEREFSWDVDLLAGYRYAVGQAGLYELREALERKEYTVLLMMGWQGTFLLRSLFFSKISGIPVMVRGDSHLNTPRSWIKRMVKEPIYRIFLSQFDLCLSVGDASAAYYHHYDVPKNKILPSPHCVDNEWFGSKRKELRARRGELRARWGLKNEDRVFLFVGRLSGMKRVNDFIKALCILSKEEIPDYSLSNWKRQGVGRIKGLIVGDGPLRKSLEDEAKALSVSAVFTGFLNQSEIVQAYVVSDCLVLPSDGRETWGLVVNEAMACGLPCIVADQVGCSLDMIVSGKNGMIFKGGNAQDLAQKMMVWSSKDVRDDTKLANEWILQKHSCESAVHGILHGIKILS
jgi:glycosyltransferase involved in cell wall biosynthesis